MTRQFRQPLERLIYYQGLGVQDLRLQGADPLFNLQPGQVENKAGGLLYEHSHHKTRLRLPYPLKDLLIP